MRRLIARLSLCGLLFCAAAVHAATPDEGLFQHVLARLGEHTAVRAEFEQTRANPALAHPQVSRGQLLFVVGHGMLWQTQTPFAETLAFTGRHAARVDGQGGSQPLRDARGVSQISQMLQSMLSGRTDEVLRLFDVQASGTSAQWTLRFTPKQSRMARVLASIELGGGASFLQAIRITMQDGGSTDIRLSHTRDAGSLDPLEKRELDLP
jgi:hypothetical protein